ncbi:TipJ family phage tail tip protein [Pseudomonas fulva]
MGAVAQIQVAGAKGGESKPKTAVETPDTLRSTNIAKILLAVGEGEFDGTPTDRDIYLDNTPLVDASGNVNFPGVKWEWRPGSIEQDYIKGIPAVENETVVNVELRSDNPFTRTLSNHQLSAVRLRFNWQRLARQDENGTFGYRIEYAIDVATDGGAFVESLLGAVDGKTTTGYQRSERVNLPKATSGWAFRVRRITPNAKSDRIADTMMIAGYTEIIDQKIRYPNTALLYIEFDAQQFQNIPTVTVDCKAQRWPVPSNYDPVGRTYSGVWDGTFKQAWTNNPVWATYGICVNDRFGLGKRIQPWMVDKWEMYRISQYCDQSVSNGIGGLEPRYLCDLNLQGRAEAWTLLRDLSAIYRGMVYWAQGSLYMQADMPRAQDIDYVFTRSNVIDGKFIYGGAGRDTHYSRALVSYDNPANNYDTDVIPVTDFALQRRYRDRPIEISAIGCTRASEAQRRGKWVLLSNSQDRTVTFKTGMEGANVLPGFVIPVADELVAGRPNGGRISATAGKVITLDRDTPIKAGDRLIVNLPNGTAQGRTVQSVAGRAVTVTTAYTLQPEPQLQWAIDYEDLAVQLFRVLKRTNADGGYEFTALEFNPSKFAAIDTGAKLDERPISVIPVTTVQPPESVLLSSSHMVDQGIAVNTMTIAWPTVQGAVAYDVEWRKDNGNWVSMQRTGLTSVDVTGIYAGAYMARVRSVSAFDITSIWKSSALTQLNGKEGVPPSVTFLRTESLLFGIKVLCGIPPGAEDTQRTELWYSEGTDLGAATKLADLAYPQSEHVMQGLRAGQRFFFWARLVDRSGNVGPFFPVAPTVVTGIASADASPILEQIKDQITESELGKELTSKIQKIALIDGNGPGSVNERVGAAKTELATQISEVNNALGTVKGNLEQQITAVSADVSAAKTELQQQIANVSALAGSLPYRKDKAYSVGQSVLGSDGKLYQALKAVPLNTPPPNATYWTDVGQAVVTANGMAARVSKVETDVSTLDGKVTAQASQISGLQSSLTTTNGNVSAAQQAAQDAATLAGGKGKVIVQSAAPAVADRLAQNLWIDTTGNANTPKRWSGSAWVAVTDKVATDAAAAAQSALSQVALKADASVVSNLSTRVSDAEGKLTSQATRMDGMQTSIDGKASSQALQQVTSRVTATEDKDKTQDQLISSQSQALTSLTDSVSKKADASTVQALGNAVTQQGQDLTALGQSLTKIDVALGQAGGENWIYNPSFEKPGANGLADGWATAGASGVTTTPSLVPSALAAGEMAQRIDVTGVSASAWSRIGNPSTRRVEVSPGTPVSMSAFVRGTPGINVRCEIQFLNSAGGGISGVPVASNTALTGDFNRVSHTVLAPAGAVRCNYFVTVYGTASIASGFLEVDRTQIEFSSVVTGWRDNGAVDAGNAAATASAVQSLTGRVDQAESSLTSQSGSIVSLQNGLTATNSNVTAAQQAAQAAATAAGAKGEVIYGSSAPAADKRLVQNLWIDTTGNANTPKRWNGSAWVAVTDKVATDAAAAAATALSQVATKAEASAVQALNSKVEQQGSTITANGQAITNLSASLTGLGGGKVNLLPAEYSVFGSTLPALSGSSFNASSVPDAAAMRGYALKLDWSSASTGLAVHFSTSVAAAGMNMALRAKRYIVSYYAKASVAGHQVANYLRVLQADGVSTTTGPAALATLGTDWARYAVVIDMTSATYTGSRMQLSFQMNRSGGADRSVWLDRIMVEEAAEGATAPSAFVPGTSFDQSQLNAEATSALSSRVSQTEQGLTSVSSNVTSLTNSLGQTGGENWIYNPSFEKQGTSSLSDGWAIAGGSGAVVTPSRVASALAQGEIAQRIDVTGISSSVWARIGNPSSRRVTVSPGTPVTMSAFVRGTSGLAVRCEVQFLNSSGGGISGTPVATNATATSEFARITHSVVAPEGTVECNFFVTCYGTAAISNAFMEVDRTQLEFSATVSGWKDNGKVAIAEQGALSTAVESLSSAVTQQGGTLTSVSSRTTALENSVNSGSNGLATKASAASVTTLGNRVSAAENSLTSASSSITDLQNTLGSVGGAVNLVPAEYSVFGATPPAMNKQASLNASSVASADAVGKYLLKLDSTVSQVNYFYLAASGTDWTMKLKPGKKYILSFWVQADAARAMSLRIRYPNAAGSNVEAELAQVNVMTAMTRVSAVLTMPAALVDSSCLVFYQSRTASASSHLYDGFMLEEQVGANETPSTFSVGYSARETQAASRALSELSSTVSTQGGTITAQAQRIDGLQSSVGNASAAIQGEAKTRSDADSALSTRITTAQAKADDALAAAQSEVTARADADTALGKRVDTVQSNLGSTNASVQQISTAQTSLNNKVNASYSVRLQVTAGGQYVAAGFGLGADNSSGVLQSVFAVMADRFAVLNPSGNGFVSPFAIQNGQVFLNEAFISSATIQRAIVGNSINSSELANNGVPIMRMDFASGTIIMQNKAASAYTVFNRSGIDMVINGVRRIRMGEW